MNKKYSESVLVFPRSVLDKLPKFDRITRNFYSQLYIDNGPNKEVTHVTEFNMDDIGKYCSWSIKYDKEIFNSGECFFLDRNVAEGDETVKQVIPYVVILRITESGEEKVLVYRRGKSGGESRLHDQHSLGWGGHINTLDHQNNPVDAYYRCIQREIQEELSLNINPQLSIVSSVINDDSNEVGRVHFGIVSALFLTESEAESLRFEDSAKEPQWLTVEEASKLNLEGWSRLIVDGGYL